MAFFNNMKKKFGDYSPQYWVVISLELFERGAYYGIMGYFPVHALYNLGFTGTAYGAMYALLVALLYFVPIIAASLAKKFGYRKILLTAFIIMIPTYLTMTFLESEITFFFAIVAWGIGAGAFKPMVSATIAHVTEKEHRNSAYSIYYLSINWGSFLAMLAIGFLIPQHFAQIVFLVGAVLITINLIITFLLYKDPVEKDPTEKMSNAFVKMGMVLRDKKFTILLLLYSGFFIIFSSMHTFIPAYYVGFGIQPYKWFTVPLISAINPLTIVTLGPFLARITDRFDSLKLMITGMAIFSFGLMILGLIPVWYAMALGIFIYSVGEFITHPSFISYVSKIAPEEKVALYMGYAFLPSAVGNVLGSLFGGVMWDLLAVRKEMASLFFMVYVAIGVLTIGNFLIYNRFFGPKPKGEMKIKKGFFNSKWSFVGVWALIPILILAGTSMGTTTYTGDRFGQEVEVITYNDHSVSISFDVDLTEGESYTHEFIITNSTVQWVNISATWRDQPDQNGIIRNYENQPDTFSIEYIPTNGSTNEDSKTASNLQGQPGEIDINHRFLGEEEDNTLGTGLHSLVIDLTDVGQYEATFDLGFFTPTDGGNAISVQIQYSYVERIVTYEKATGSAGH